MGILDLRVVERLIAQRKVDAGASLTKH